MRYKCIRSVLENDKKSWISVFQNRIFDIDNMLSINTIQK